MRNARSEKRTGKFFNVTWRVVKGGLTGLGGLAAVMIILAFTSAPFWIWYGLGTSNAEIKGDPDYIVVLGGSGIPSESGLMRTYYTGVAASSFPDAMVIVALPGDTADSLSSVNKMREELIQRGIAPERILVEDSGTNTRAQAILTGELISDRGSGIRDPGSGIRDNQIPQTVSSIAHRVSRILLITSPEHLYRAVLTFRKAGFEKVDGLPAFASDIESDISFSSKKLGGRRWVPDVGESITLRYQFWTQLQYEILIAREYMAIGYYWLMGWI